jgi:hypothetical protein
MGPTLYDVVGALRDESPSMLKRAYRARALRKVRTKFDSKGRKKSQEVEVQESQTNGFVCRDRKRGRG